MNSGLPLLLGGFDESSSHITVFVKRKGEGQTAGLRIAHCCSQTGIRDSGNKIRFDRIGSGKGFSGADSGIIYVYIVHCGIQTGKIDVFENTMCVRNMCSFTFLDETGIGFDPIFGNGNDLTGKDITYKFCVYSCQGAAFRCQDVAVPTFAQA